MTRAYSPSSSTLQSMASVMTMQLPSMADLKLATRSWNGRLRRGDPTVAGLFSEAGYATLRIAHNYARSFDRTKLGLERGFLSDRLVPSPVRAPNTDAIIVSDAIARIDEAGRAGRFFAWVFLVSPHEPYVVHNRAKPRRTPLDRYRQELAYMDARVGDLLGALERSGRLDDTVVVFTGDHGEEFREHGGTLHKQTVYTESIHVPLLIRVPGMQGRVMTRPTSLMYLFPWLLRTGTTRMRAVVDDRLRNKIGPLLRATDGGVVAELLGHDRMESTLIWQRYKVDYDFRTDAIELFDVEQDPLEQNNVLGDVAETGDILARLEAYRFVRDGLARFEYAKQPTARAANKP